MKVESLNATDCFILDSRLKVVGLNTTKQSAWDEGTINVMTNEFQSSRRGRAQETYIIDGSDDRDDALLQSVVVILIGDLIQLQKKMQHLITMGVQYLTRVLYCFKLIVLFIAHVYLFIYCLSCILYILYILLHDCFILFNCWCSHH